LFPASRPAIRPYALGEFKQDTLPIGSIGRSQITAARIIDRVHWR